jgi:hypothetical protein
MAVVFGNVPNAVFDVLNLDSLLARGHRRLMN